VGEVFNVTTSAVTSAGYTAALADVVRVPAEVIPLPKEFAENSRGPLFSRLFAPAHHGMLDATKITQALGVTSGLDLRARPRPHARVVSGDREAPVRRLRALDARDDGVCEARG
jgi:hypothetical protein